jgi:hypothetical protein
MAGRPTPQIARIGRGADPIHLNDYVFVYERSCFCGGDANQPLRVVVTAGVVTSVTRADGEPAVMPGLTVDDMFSELRTWISADPHSFDAHYDPTLGYPHEAAVHFSASGSDDTDMLEVTCFQASPIDVASSCPIGG